MKVRTDFVTNSSSSSFIFKETDVRNLEERIKREAEKVAVKESSPKCREWTLDQVNCMEIKKIREHDTEDLLEVYNWYWSDILALMFEELAEYKHLDWEEQDAFWNKFVDSIPQRQIPDDILMKIAGILVIEFVDLLMLANRVASLNREEIEQYFADYLEVGWMQTNRTLYTFVTSNCEKLREMVLKYADVHIGVIIEELLEAEYMCFDFMGVHYLVADQICNFPECILGCNHMG